MQCTSARVQEVALASLLSTVLRLPAVTLLTVPLIDPRLKTQDARAAPETPARTGLWHEQPGPEGEANTPAPLHLYHWAHTVDSEL